MIEDFLVHIGSESTAAEVWESRCHDVFDLFRIKGELFSVPFSSAVKAVDGLRPLDSELASIKSENNKVISGNYSGAVSLINDCEKIVKFGSTMGDLTSLWAIGNVMRVNEGKKPANLSKFLSSEKTRLFIEACGKNGYSNPVIIDGVGNKKRTWAVIHMMIYAAEYLSVEFNYQIIDAFVNGLISDYDDYYTVSISQP